MMPAGAQRNTVEKATMDQIERGYVCPSDAGPFWRAACEAGIDMALLEDSLQMTPAERLRDHQRALNFVLTIEEKRPAENARG